MTGSHEGKRLLPFGWVGEGFGEEVGSLLLGGDIDKAKVVPVRLL